MIIRKIANQNDIDFKNTSYGKRRRSDKEKQYLLDNLVAEIRNNFQQTSATANELRLKDWLDTWRKELTLRTDQAKREYVNAVLRFIDCVGNLKLSSMRTDSSYQFIKVMDDKNLSRNSTRSYIRMVNIYLNYLHKRDLMPHVSLNTVPQENRSIGVYSNDDLNRIELHLQERQHRNGLRMVKLLRYLGLRASEVRTLPLRHINLDKQRIVIRRVDELNWIPKKGKEAVLPIPSPLLKFLEEDLANRYRQEKYYLDSGQGCPAFKDVSAMSKVLRPVLRKLKLYGEVKPLHGYRASLVTSLLKQKVSPRIVQSICRHSKVETTMGYASYNTGQIKEALELL